ncbi:hypothetical protein C8F04DRAFT_1074052 [Mycena alexandri]|uniref:GATA-type domain-containing protein n=1 Tax=Mycena alexandri TaxID=1745969 RepID=A0AAD6TD50_9AGAR|nr:hypothetical protein C8F04DRAFT_1074052 [Mycena alexandri]
MANTSLDAESQHMHKRSTDHAASTNSTRGDSRVLRVLPRRGHPHKIAVDSEGPAEATTPAGRHYPEIPLHIQATPTHIADSIARRPFKRRRLDIDTSACPALDTGDLTPPAAVQSCGNCSTNRPGRWCRSKLLLVTICRACYRYESKHCKSRPSFLAERARARAEPSLIIQCGNCSSTGTASGWHSSKILVGANICSACDRYERRHSKCRPLSLAQLPRRTVDPEDCGNCGTRTSSKNEWLHSTLLIGHKICCTCYAYEKKHSKCRPPSLIQRAQERAQLHTECGNCRSKTSADSIWHSSILQPSVKLCQACDSYERRTGTSRPESLNKRKSWHLTKCNNCGERKPREWRTDDQGKTLCDEFRSLRFLVQSFFWLTWKRRCGIYYLANGFARPLSSEDIRRRRARLRRERHRNPPADVPETSTGSRIQAKPSAAPSRVCSNCQSTTVTRGWGDSMLELDWLCRACKQYEIKHKRHRPLSVIQRVRLHPGPDGCSNCGIAESQWRGRWNRSILTPGWIICHVCKSYERLQKRHRPQRLWKDT